MISHEICVSKLRVTGSALSRLAPRSIFTPYCETDKSITYSAHRHNMPTPGLQLSVKLFTVCFDICPTFFIRIFKKPSHSLGQNGVVQQKSPPYPPVRNSSGSRWRELGDSCILVNM